MVTIIQTTIAKTSITNSGLTNFSLEKGKKYNQASKNYINCQDLFITLYTHNTRQKIESPDQIKLQVISNQSQSSPSLYVSKNRGKNKTESPRQKNVFTFLL